MQEDQILETFIRKILAHPAEQRALREDMEDVLERENMPPRVRNVIRQMYLQLTQNAPLPARISWMK